MTNSIPRLSCAKVLSSNCWLLLTDSQYLKGTQLIMMMRNRNEIKFSHFGCCNSLIFDLTWHFLTLFSFCQYKMEHNLQKIWEVAQGVYSIFSPPDGYIVSLWMCSGVGIMSEVNVGDLFWLCLGQGIEILDYDSVQDLSLLLDAADNRGILRRLGRSLGVPPQVVANLQCFQDLFQYLRTSTYTLLPQLAQAAALLPNPDIVARIHQAVVNKWLFKPWGCVTMTPATTQFWPTLHGDAAGSPN